MLPFDVKHLNGIVPKHDVNWAEISQNAGCSKHKCKEYCELMFRKLSDKAHAGLRVDERIPYVGSISISIGICAAIFNSDLIDESRGKTAIDYKKRHHSAFIPNNLVNAKMLEQNKSNTFNTMKQKLDNAYQESNIGDLMSEINLKMMLHEQKDKANAMPTMKRAGAASVRSLRSIRTKAVSSASFA